MAYNALYALKGRTTGDDSRHYVKQRNYYFNNLQVR